MAFTLFLLLTAGLASAEIESTNSSLADIFNSIDSGPVEGDRVHALCDAGRLLGRRAQAGSFVYYKFLSVPYAKSPTGKLRLRSPVTNTKWTGELEAVRDMPHCLQADPISGGTLGQEDCLYANIYTPFLPDGDVKRQELLPVMVWLHGGDFNSGSGSEAEFDPVDFVRRGIVVVSVNYRLGYLGFMAMGENPDLHGNLGLADQQAALKWIKPNARYFGGDKYDVTIVGHEAGAQSVHLHLLSPKSKKLFSKAIAQSGSPLYRHFVDANAEMFERSRRMAQLMGCDNMTNSMEVECLQGVAASRFVELTADVGGADVRPIDDRGSRYALTPFDPLASLVNGDGHGVPILMGLAANEGHEQSSRLFPDGSDLAAVLDNVTAREVFLLGNSSWEDEPQMSLMARHSLSRYCHNSTSLRCLHKLISDANFVSPGHTTASYHARHNKRVYLYVLAAPCDSSGADGIVSHREGLRCLQPAHDGSNATEAEALLSRTLVDVWSAFVKSGEPSTNATQDWPPMEWPYGCFVQLCHGAPVGHCNVPERFAVWNELQTRVSFWDRLYWFVARQSLRIRRPPPPQSGPVLPASSYRPVV